MIKLKIEDISMVAKKFVIISILCSFFANVLYSVPTTQHGVTLTVVANDVPYIFIRDTLGLPDIDYTTKNIRPVLVGIANNSGEPVVICPQSFGDVILNYENVAKQFFYKSKLASLGFVLGSALLVGFNIEKNRRDLIEQGIFSMDNNECSFSQACYLTFFGDRNLYINLIDEDFKLLPITKYLGYAGLLAMPFYWWYAHQYNNNIDAILKEFVLHQKEMVESGNKIEKIIFLDATKLSENQEVQCDIRLENGVAYFDIKK